jgi:hypothetical protein
MVFGSETHPIHETGSQWQGKSLKKAVFIKATLLIMYPCPGPGTDGVEYR